MNELSHLERFRSDVPRPGLADLHDQEQRLLAAIAEAGPSKPVKRRRSMSRLVASLAVTATLAAAALFGLTLVQSPATATSFANEAIDIKLLGDEYVATIKDPFADHALYTEGFKALGLDVSLRLVPASPTAVGDIVRFESRMQSRGWLSGGLLPLGCTPGSPDCLLTVTISKEFSGKGTIYLGRPAKHGERYQSNASAETEGEMLEGYDPVERTVSEVAAEARKRGLKVVFQVIRPAKDGNGFSVDPDDSSTKVGDHWIVWAAEPEQAGTVRLLVSEKRLAKNPVYGDSIPTEPVDL